MAAEGLAAQACCRVLGVSESGYYARRIRPPSVRSVRHAWLTDVIRTVHADSRATYMAAGACTPSSPSGAALWSAIRRSRC